ncbi:uncharacterized protein LOC127241354 [Andrographis paniculata]|uniref:uncharacterized protein LOC127241354 n=1 Tax=Andrographis paniculata TaxID=175694 RepID=UPI0021E9865E|nr:uncharacterized protein LOC127241354 [Andrographis paniculata]
MKKSLFLLLSLWVLSSAATLLQCLARESSKDREHGHGINYTKVATKEDRNERELADSDKIYSTEKSGKGTKGSNGASNVVHQHPGEKNAAALFYSPYLVGSIFFTLLAFVAPLI